MNIYSIVIFFITIQSSVFAMSLSPVGMERMDEKVEVLKEVPKSKSWRFKCKEGPVFYGPDLRRKATLSVYIDSNGKRFVFYREKRIPVAPGEHSVII
jgi:hypothetical protein